MGASQGHFDTTERALVAEAYPGSRFGAGVWQVPMRPFAADDRQFQLVAADLVRGDVVQLLPGGELAHSPECPQAVHEGAGLPRPRPQRFRVELSLPSTLFGAAGPVHPRARIGTARLGSFGLTPSMRELRYRGHPHLSSDGKGDVWACPLPPHDTDWTWEPGAALAYLDQVTIWLFKTEVWAATCLWPLRPGVWLGDSAGHAPAEVLAYPTAGTCRCGSGRGYGDCHRARDLQDWFKQAA